MTMDRITIAGVTFLNPEAILAGKMFWKDSGLLEEIREGYAAGFIQDKIFPAGWYLCLGSIDFKKRWFGNKLLNCRDVLFTLEKHGDMFNHGVILLTDRGPAAAALSQVYEKEKYDD